MRETSKAYRLLKDDPLFKSVPRGTWLDIGAGDDPLPGARGWDKADGDAHILPGILPESQDLLFSSHCLEHLERPYDAIERWLEVTRPGGFVWIIVPHWQLYEHEQWPSKYNPDHKWAFMPYRNGEIQCKNLLYLDDISYEFDMKAEVKRIATRANGYDINSMHLLSDQTLGEAEAACELVLRKLTN